MQPSGEADDMYAFSMSPQTTGIGIVDDIFRAAIGTYSRFEQRVRIRQALAFVQLWTMRTMYKL